MSTTQLIIAGWAQYPDGVRDIVLEHLLRSAEASRTEDGCLDFNVSKDPSSSSRLFVFERWATPESHAVHLDLPHVEEYRKSVKDLRSLDRALNRYSAVDLGSL